jgi:hypothetical protein
MHVCAPCLYKVNYEPVMKFSFLAAMDGNNSLKLVDSTFRSGTPRTDTRTSESTWWINPEDVDRFRDEVGKVRIYTIVYLPNLILDLTASAETATATARR